MNDRTALVAGALVGTLVGAAASYLFFTERGRDVRDRLEPAIDDLRREFLRFQRAVEKLGQMANDGMRVVQEFNAARMQPQFRDDDTSH